MCVLETRRRRPPLIGRFEAATLVHREAPNGHHVVREALGNREVVRRSPRVPRTCGVGVRPRRSDATHSSRELFERMTNVFRTFVSRLRKLYGVLTDRFQTSPTAPRRAT